LDFFGAQDLARRKTWRLAALFGAAVLSLVVLTNLLVASVYAWATGFGYATPVDLESQLRGLPPLYWLWISVGVVGAVALASLYKYLLLRGGGRTVAESLGGRLVHQATTDARERRALNVVAEMAIASGLPVPPLYVIEAPSINAFAAGFGTSDAVIGLNRGTLDHLTRDELQGVVAHEFSHLLNGDTRLNVRLLALLHGILFVGLVGQGLLRGSASRGVRRSRGAGGGALPILVLGLGMLVIGYAGTFFGKLIKAAVSRQREYLADAASVQFTRNPQGIAGALKKIGGLDAGSTMPGTAANEASHLFFGAVTRAWLGGLTATHPPLDRRIRAIDPTWNGAFPLISLRDGTARSDEAGPDTRTADAGASGLAGAATDPTTMNVGTMGVGMVAETLTAAVGTLDDRSLDQAVTLINRIPAALQAAAHDVWASRALLYALVMADGGPYCGAQLRLIEETTDAALAAEAARLLPLLAGQDEPQRLVLAELAIPALKEMSTPQYRRFTATLIDLIKIDQRIELFEWVLHRLLVRDLKSHFEGPAKRHQSRDRLEDRAAEVGVLLTALAREQAAPAGEQPAGVPDVREAFRLGLATAGIDAAFDEQPDPDFQRLSRALQRLRELPPLQTPRLLKACATTVLADGRMSGRQGALLQGIAATLECPLPPSIYGGVPP